VTQNGSVVWLCFPRFDSESVFAEILDDDAGHWSIHPAETATSTRQYVDETMVLRTTFHTATGDLELLDAMEVGDSSDPHRLGEHAPHTLLRGVRCTNGRVVVEMTYRPRPEYGLVVPIFSEIVSGSVATGGSGRLTLSMPETITDGNDPGPVHS
jgi:GH15 family glucan-1,4-alpha-glucosidase